jgi:hypothetical protein
MAKAQVPISASGKIARLNFITDSFPFPFW